MHEVRTAPSRLERSVSQFNEPLTPARISAPTTPSAAASVAVAQPA